MNKKQKYPASKKSIPPKADLKQVTRKKSSLETAWEKLEKLNSKFIFWISIAVIFCLLFFMTSKSCLVGDGVIEYFYGEQCLDYFLSGSKDTACLDFVFEENSSYPNEKYYGVGFDGTFAGLHRIFKFEDVFSARLYYLVFWNIFVLIFIGLIARELAGWRSASLALWITFLTPFFLGQMLWNSKDLPHALGFAIGLFFIIRFFRKLPDISMKNALGIAVGIAVALSVRIGGVLIVAYLILFSLIACVSILKVYNLFVVKNYKQILKITGVLILTAFLGVVCGLLFYPNFYEVGFKHILDATTVVNKFPQRIPFIYGGKMIDSLQLPAWFLVKMFYITTPLSILIMLHLAFFVVLWKYKKIGIFNVFILVFTLIFPFIYMAMAKANVYDGWRHVLFAYVTAPVIIAVGYKELLEMWKSVTLKWLLSSAVVLSLAYLFVWNVKNTPYQLVYYNEFVGGTKKAFKKYDFNQSQIGGTHGIDWVLKNNSPDNYSEERPMVVTINSPVCKYYHIPEKWRGKVVVTDISFRGYAATKCDYAVLMTFFVNPQQLSFFYPPRGTVYKETVDDIPMFCVVDRRKDTDYLGIELLQENKIEEGMAYLEQAYEYNPRNYTLYFWLGYGYYRTGDNVNAVKMLDSYRQFFPTDQNANRFLGYAYYGLQQYSNALEAFNISFSQDPSDLSVAYLMGVCWYEMKDYNRAENFLQQIINENPSFTDGINLLRQVQSAKR